MTNLHNQVISPHLSCPYSSHSLPHFRPFSNTPSFLRKAPRRYVLLSHPSPCQQPSPNYLRQPSNHTCKFPLSRRAMKNWDQCRLATPYEHYVKIVMVMWCLKSIFKTVLLGLLVYGILKWERWTSLILRLYCSDRWTLHAKSFSRTTVGPADEALFWISDLEPRDHFQGYRIEYFKWELLLLTVLQSKNKNSLAPRSLLIWSIARSPADAQWVYSIQNSASGRISLTLGRVWLLPPSMCSHSFLSSRCRGLCISDASLSWSHSGLVLLFIPIYGTVLFFLT